MTPFQEVTSPLLSVYTAADGIRVRNLAALAQREAENALAGATLTLLESQPFVEAVEWTPDVVEIRIARNADGSGGITVKREVFGASDSVPLL